MNLNWGQRICGGPQSDMGPGGEKQGVEKLTFQSLRIPSRQKHRRVNALQSPLCEAE